jgi:hypothetical protein
MITTATTSSVCLKSRHQRSKEPEDAFCRSKTRYRLGDSEVSAPNLGDTRFCSVSIMWFLSKDSSEPWKALGVDRNGKKKRLTSNIILKTARASTAALSDTSHD